MMIPSIEKCFRIFGIASVLAAMGVISRPVSAQNAPPTTAQANARLLGAGGNDSGFDMAPETRLEVVEAAVAAIPVKIPEGPVKPTWESLAQNYKVPQWYTEARFGLSMHWGLYSVPAYHNEWYEKHMYGQFIQWHKDHFGAQDVFGYKDFIPMFKAEKFDPNAWAELFKKSGAKWFAPTVQHHDNFALWDSKVTPFNAMQMGPKRDVMGELAKAVRAQGLKFGVSNHGIENFQFINPPPALAADLKAKQVDLYDPKWADFYNNARNLGPKRDIVGEMSVAMRKQGLKFGACDHSMEHYNFITSLPDLKTDVLDPDWKDFYSVADRTPQRRLQFDNAWRDKQIELIDKYQLDTLWWDNGANGANLDPYKLPIFAHFCNRGLEWGKEIAIISKGGARGGHVQDYERQGRGSKVIEERTFEVHDSPGQRWCYLTDDRLWPSFDIIWRIVENTSKNGNLLFNIGPKPDGTIGEDYRRLLTDAGKWLNVNGEAIYASRPWKKFGEGASLNNSPRYTAQDIRFTTKGDALYAIFMAWPGTEGTITSITPDVGKVQKVEMLGHDGPLEFGQDASGLKIKTPSEKPCDFAYTVKITGLKIVASS